MLSVVNLKRVPLLCVSVWINKIIWSFILSLPSKVHVILTKILYGLFKSVWQK